MIYAVIDTNVLVSALITHNPQSATEKVVKHLLNGSFTALFDSEIVEEYMDVLHRKKFPINPDVADALVEFITKHGIDCGRSEYNQPMPDEDDRVFYEVALSVDESFLVTGNLKHYPITPKVITPADFMKHLDTE